MEDENNGEKPKKRRKKAKAEQKISEEMLRRAVSQVAVMLCEVSAERDFFISDGTQSKRKLDTKTLREFAAVLKEVCSVIADMNGEQSSGEGVRIEFSPDALNYSS